MMRKRLIHFFVVQIDLQDWSKGPFCDWLIEWLRLTDSFDVKHFGDIYEKRNTNYELRIFCNNLKNIFFYVKSRLCFLRLIGQLILKN